MATMRDPQDPTWRHDQMRDFTVIALALALLGAATALRTAPVQVGALAAPAEISAKGAVSPS
jgi:hypothetical protein